MVVLVMRLSTMPCQLHQLLLCSLLSSSHPTCMLLIPRHGIDLWLCMVVVLVVVVLVLVVAVVVMTVLEAAVVCY
jgi:hypothetical protein